MVTFELTVVPGGELDNHLERLNKVLTWPVLPRIGDELDLCNPGFAGGPTGIVTRVVHWLGLKDRARIQVFLRLAAHEDVRHCWDILSDDGWSEK